MIINGREYILLKIYEKNQRMKDIFLCKDVKNGLKECFYRYEIEPKEETKSVAWTSEEIEYLKKCIKENKKFKEVYQGFINENRTEAAIMVRYHNLKREMKNNDN